MCNFAFSSPKITEITFKKVPYLHVSTTRFVFLSVRVFRTVVLRVAVARSLATLVYVEFLITGAEPFCGIEDHVGRVTHCFECRFESQENQKIYSPFSVTMYSLLPITSAYKRLFDCVSKKQ